jgi:protein with PEP-CTERM/exosortase system signal
MNLRKLAAIVALPLVASANATIIQVGSLAFTGDFTLNHLYDFNNPGAQPFGWFGTETVSSSDGIFADHISVGDILQGAGVLNVVTNLPLFSLNGLQFATTDAGVTITGSDSGRYLYGNMTIVGDVEGFDSALWAFVAPPYDIENFHEHITGPITLQFKAFFDVPDSGSTIVLMGLGLTATILSKRRLVRKHGVR